jgi:predicted phage terminase large subunit-like protein
MPPVFDNIAAQADPTWLAARKRARSDRLFLADLLGYDFTEETHKELFDQYPAFDGKQPWADKFPDGDVLILWPRGHFKSTAVVVLAIQAILCNPDIRILLMQGTIKVTKGLLKEIASHFDGTHSRTQLSTYYPEFCGNKKTLELTADRFSVANRERRQLQQATCTVASPKSIKTGQHYDLGFFDDLVNDGNYRNPLLLAKVEEDFNMARPLVDPGCPRFVSGTRYAFGDLYENIIRRNKGEWVVSVKTCWKEDGVTPRFPQYKTKDGRLVGLTREMLMQIASDSPGIYSSQYLNYPIASSQQVLPEHLLLGAVIPEKDAPALSQAVLFVDLASEGENPDDSVCIAGKVDQVGRMYAVDMQGGVLAVAPLAVMVCNCILKHRPMKVMIEKTASACYFVEYLKVVMRDKGIVCSIEYIKVNNQPDAKNKRVESLAGHIKNKRFYFFAGLNAWEKFIEQAKQFPKGRHGHDDWPDTAGLMAQVLSVGYKGLAQPVSRHPMVNLMAQDPVMQGIDNMGAEINQPHGDCGSEFAC